MYYCNCRCRSPEVYDGFNWKPDCRNVSRYGSKCSNCDSTHALDYWCLEDEKAPIKAEGCNECQTYLKAFYQQADHQLELVADDLASLALDAEMEEKELARSGINPLMLPLLA